MHIAVMQQICAALWQALFLYAVESRFTLQYAGGRGI